MAMFGSLRLRVPRLGTMLTASLLVSACAGWESYEPRDDRVEGPEQGLFTGESREFVIHRRIVRPDGQTKVEQ